MICPALSLLQTHRHIREAESAKYSKQIRKQLKSQMIAHVSYRICEHEAHLRNRLCDKNSTAMETSNLTHTGTYAYPLAPA